MHWCIQENIYNETGFIELKRVLSKLDISWSEHKLVPFVYDLEPVLNVNHNNVICFGSYAMLNVAKKYNLTPGVFDISHITYDLLIQKWADAMLNHDSIQIMFKDLYNIKHEEFFMRPVTDTKEIAGKTYDIYDEDLKKIWKYTTETNVDDLTIGGLKADTLLVISSVKKILQEYRFFVIDGKIVTGSSYKIGGKPHYAHNVDQSVINYAQEMVDMYQPSEAFVIDIALTNDGYKIIEVNTFNAAGFYNSDISKIVFSLLEKYR